MDFGYFGENYFLTLFSIIFLPPAGGKGRGASGGALRVGCGRSACRDFSIIFWARRRKAVRQGFDPELFMTEHIYYKTYTGANHTNFSTRFKPSTLKKLYRKFGFKVLSFLGDFLVNFFE